MAVRGEVQEEERAQTKTESKSEQQCRFPCRIQRISFRNDRLTSC